MQLSIKLTPAAAAAFRSEPREAATSRSFDDLRETAADLGLNLKPMHPAIDDPELSTWFTVEVPNQQSPVEVRDRLLSLDAVESAFEPARAEPP